MGGRPEEKKGATEGETHRRLWFRPIVCKSCNELHTFPIITAKYEHPEIALLQSDGIGGAARSPRDRVTASGGAARAGVRGRGRRPSAPDDT